MPPQSSLVLFDPTIQHLEESEQLIDINLYDSDVSGISWISQFTPPFVVCKISPPIIQPLSLSAK